MHLHNDACYGLGWMDRHELFGEGSKQEVKQAWRAPTADDMKKHAQHIQNIHRQSSIPYRFRNSTGVAAAIDAEEIDTDTNQD